MSAGLLINLEQAIRSFSPRRLTLVRRLTGASRRETGALAQRLRELVELVPTLSKEIEHRYEQSGMVLQPISEASAMLIAESENLMRMAVGQADGDQVVAGTSRLLQAALDYLDSWRADVLKRLSQLHVSSEILYRLKETEATLQDLISPLTHTQTMFRIESARLPENIRQAFAALTEQIAVVHSEVNETFGRQFQIVGDTVHILDQATQTIETQAGQVEIELQKRKDNIAESLARLHQELAKNSRRDVELTSTSKAVATAISGIVVALQTHDIASQRLAHIREALEESAELVSRRVAGKDGENPLEKAFYLVAVQRAQLEGVHSQIKLSEDSLRKAVADINGKITTLDCECLMLKEFEEVTVAVNGSVQVSIELLVDVRTLLAGVIGSSRDFYLSIDPIGRLTAKLNGALEGLAAKMRLIALNAQIQAVHIGSGTGLEVLSAHIAGISTRTSELAESISEDISTLVATIQDLTASFQALTDRGEEHLRILELDGQAHEAVLHDVRDRTLNKLSLVGQAIDYIRDCTKNIAEQNDARGGALVPVEEVMRKLSALTDDLNKLIYRFDQNTAAETSRTKYCMASEREAHERVLKSFSEDPSDSDPGHTSEAAPESTADQEVLVELF